jgi:hypothetical protein
MIKQLKTVGEYIAYTSMFFLLIMGIVGTMSIDIVILAVLLKEAKHNDNAFATGFLWGLLFSYNRPYYGSSHYGPDPLYDNAGILICVSLIMTAIAMVLAATLGVPEIALFLAIGWGGAIAITSIGLGVYGFAEWLEGLLEESVIPVAEVIHDTNGNSYRTMHTHGLPAQKTQSNHAKLAGKDSPENMSTRGLNLFSELKPASSATNFGLDDHLRLST